MNLYKEIVQNLFCGMAIVKDGKILQSNRYAAEVFGIKPGIFFKNDFFSIIHEDDIEKVINYHSMRLQGHEVPAQYYCRAYNLNRDIIWLKVRAVIISRGRDKAVLKFFEDVTREKNDLDRLEKSEENLRSIIEASLDAVVGTDESGRIVMFNQVAEELFKYRESQVLGEPISMLLRDEFSGNHQMGLEKFLIGGAGRCGHIGKRIIKNFKDSEGRVFEAELAMSGARSRNNRFIASFIHDVSEEQKLIRELNEANKMAQEASVLKTQFLANMSHEVRTPMNTIVGYTELMLMENTSDAHREYLEIIKESGELLLNIVDDIIDVSKVEIGEISINYSLVNIEALFSSLKKDMDLQKAKSGKNIEIRYNIEASCSAGFLCDPMRLKQILLNLIHNGIKYTDEGFVEFGVRQTADRWFEFYVRDTGKGIEDKDRLKIFEKFYQCRSDECNTPPGVGLGLSITRQLVELMGGRINVVSSTTGADKGSVFLVTLPCASINDSISTESIDSELKIQPPDYHDEYTVLVVEDNAVNQTLMKRILNKFGLSCLIAENSAQAVELLTGKSRIDLVFMDLYLPDVSGFETLNIMNSMKKEGALLKELPVIALTAASMTEDREKCIREGFDDYLAKPVNIDLLQGVLYKYLMGN